MTKKEVKATLRNIKKQLEDISQLEIPIIYDGVAGEDFEGSVGNVFTGVADVLEDVKISLKL